MFAPHVVLNIDVEFWVEESENKETLQNISIQFSLYSRVEQRIEKTGSLLPCDCILKSRVLVHVFTSISLL
jgi:hypothetical protein